MGVSEMVDVERRSAGGDEGDAWMVELPDYRCGTCYNVMQSPSSRRAQGQPMPLFETDRGDIEAASGKAYKIIGALLFEKECSLQEKEGRITELKLSLSD